MKQTINRKGNPGMLRVDGRPDRSKAPLIKPQPIPEVKPTIKPKKEAVTLTPLDPKEPYPQQDEIKPSGVITTDNDHNDLIVESGASKTKKRWSS